MDTQPEFRLDIEDEPRFLGPEFELPTDGELVDGAEFDEAERERYDEQILAALVSP